MENIVVITGAGISVESGIQPFRGKSGIWEENPMEMATYRKFREDPSLFLQWYYKRFVSCKDAEPNGAHFSLAKNNIKVITQNVDNLHVKANHPKENLIEIHGNIHFKRKINAEYMDELVLAKWDQLDENKLEAALFELFGIKENGLIQETTSYRPHVLLFDEYYTELYQYEKAFNWLEEANTIIFIGTSNAVGFTSGALQLGITKEKNIIVVDPNPSPSFNFSGIEIIKETAINFCTKYFK